MAEFDDSGLPSWFGRAACLELPAADDDAWFGPDPTDAFKVCERCPAIVQCGQHALEHGVSEGCGEG